MTRAVAPDRRTLGHDGVGTQTRQRGYGIARSSGSGRPTCTGTWRTTRDRAPSPMKNRGISQSRLHHRRLNHTYKGTNMNMDMNMNTECAHTRTRSRDYACLWSRVCVEEGVLVFVFWLFLSFFFWGPSRKPSFTCATRQSQSCNPLISQLMYSSFQERQKSPSSHCPHAQAAVRCEQHRLVELDAVLTQADSDELYEIWNTYQDDLSWPWYDKKPDFSNADYFTFRRRCVC